MKNKYIPKTFDFSFKAFQHTMKHKIFCSIFLFQKPKVPLGCFVNSDALNYDELCCIAIVHKKKKLANLISKLNFYKLISYPMDNCFTGRRDRSRQTPEKDVLYIILAGPVSSVHSLGGASYLLPV